MQNPHAALAKSRDERHFLTSIAQAEAIKPGSGKTALIRELGVIESEGADYVQNLSEENRWGFTLHQSEDRSPAQFFSISSLLESHVRLCPKAHMSFVTAASEVMSPAEIAPARFASIPAS